MYTSKIPVYQKEKGNLKINDVFSIKWKELNHDLYKGVEKPHRHDYFSLFFLAEGETIQFVDFKEYNLKKPTVLMMHPDQVHFDVDAKNAKILLITFKEGLLFENKESFSWKDVFRHTFVPVSQDFEQDFLKYIDLLMFEYGQPVPSEKVIAFLLSALLEKIRIHADRQNYPEENSNHHIIENFKHLVEAYALTEVQVSFYAKKLFISAGHLNDTIKKMTGKNAKSFINERRILEAKRLLFWTETSIQEVAWKTGFKDPAYFTRFFKKQTGLLPASFQKQSLPASN